MDYTTISIDLEVYKLIQASLNSFEETPNDVLRRLLKIDKITRTESNQIGYLEQPLSSKIEDQPSNAYFNWKGVNFRNGLKLRKMYKGKYILAEVKDGKFYCEGKFFDSPSAAGGYATGTAVNGWIFWEYYDVLSNQWKLLNNLRNK